MKRILLSSSLIVLALGSVVAGGTGAFFSDLEISRGNSFTAGEIDLKVDNESYYNGVASPDTSWGISDLTLQKFFNFLDLKPGDFGEDTISLHVDSNDAYICADITLTSNEENGQTEPETSVDQTTGPGEGELGDEVNFMWWADDGDNVFEDNESVISSGAIGSLELGVPSTVTLADSGNNIWEGAGGPVKGEETVYIGKAWCFGSLTPKALAQSEYSSPADPTNDGEDTTGPSTPEDGGYVCVGATLGDETQTDTLTADISFVAVQARHNENFLCIKSNEKPNQQ